MLKQLNRTYAKPTQPQLAWRQRESRVSTPVTNASSLPSSLVASSKHGRYDRHEGNSIRTCPFSVQPDLVRGLSFVTAWCAA